MTVIRNEQALYPEPSAKIITVLLDHDAGPYWSEDPWVDYEAAYKRFQVETRSYYDWTVGAPIPEIIATAVGTHPFQWWRESLGFNERLAFCRAACVPPPQVLNYESARQRTMPKTIKATLSPFTSAMPKINKAGKEYYDALNRTAEVVC